LEKGVRILVEVLGVVEGGEVSPLIGGDQKFGRKEEEELSPPLD